jgi:lipopolysaccharide transport system ATP-binding protein
MELTGRENIFLNGAILGMRRTEIQRKFDEIVEFAEIEKFLDTPVKRYSSGMYVRLAFAVAAHFEAEIMLVDEVLAVGDIAFQNKCLGKMRDISNTGRTVLFVSHNMAAINRLCQRSLLISAGRIERDGETPDVIADYLRLHHVQRNSWQAEHNKIVVDEIPRIYLKSARILAGSVNKTENEHTNHAMVDLQPELVNFADGFRIEIDYHVRAPGPDWALIFRLTDQSGQHIFTSWDIDSLKEKDPSETGDFRATCIVPGMLLRPGLYSVTLAAYIPNLQIIEYHEGVFAFEISAIGYPFNDTRWGAITPRFEWQSIPLKE